MTTRNPVNELESALMWATPEQARAIAASAVDLAKKYREVLEELTELSRPGAWAKHGAMGSLKRAKEVGAEGLAYIPEGMR